MKETKIVIFGKNGQLGWHIQESLGNFGKVFSFDSHEVDFRKPWEINNVLNSINPQIIINSAAYTNVDLAENEKAYAYAINSESPALIAQKAKEIGAVLFHISTDYVFDGAKNISYNEADIPNPLGIYGTTKLGGELGVKKYGDAYFIFRTSWLYSFRGENFLLKALKWGRHEEFVKVVMDQTGSPTWSSTLANIIANLILNNRSDMLSWARNYRGLYHVACKGGVSRYKFVKFIYDFVNSTNLLEKEFQVLPALTSDFPTPAKRPLYSALDSSLFEKTFGMIIPPWDKALTMCLNQSLYGYITSNNANKK